MSTPTAIIYDFTQLIENGQSLSSAEIANKSLEMMQMLAKNPALVPTWQALKETLQAIYDSLDDEQTTLPEPLAGYISSKLKRLDS